jgi:predicted TIM-barrel fold metal-dependent hydrolase
VSENVTDRELEDLHAAGFRGIRINVASGTPGLKLEHAPRLAQRIKPLGWHLQFYMNFHPEHEAQLGALPVDIVIDHFGRIPAAEGVDSPRFQALLRLLRREHCWAKLMGPYFVSSAFPSYPDLLPLARAMVKIAPERVVWGTDWPHPSARDKMPNDGDLADLLAEWVPDEAQRKRILVGNPQRLYGFG